MKPSDTSGRKQRTGFTLIELLVVVAIIALLIGILLPSLGAARETARAVACGATMRSFGQGMAIYGMEWNSSIPGPNTSGAQQSYASGAYVPINQQIEPVQNVDWISPLLGRSMNLPAKLSDRYVALFNSKLRCPSNYERFSSEYPSWHGGDVTDMPIDSAGKLYVNSYTAVIGFQVRDVLDWKESKHAAGSDPLSEQNGSLSDLFGAVKIPAGYGFRTSQVGNLSQKVLAVEGARFVNGPGNLTFNTWYKQNEGGNFMTIGPVMKLAGDPFDLNTSNIPTSTGTRYAYRHKGKMNAVFFDGHVDKMDGPTSVDVRLYFPTGSKVSSIVGLRDKTARAGMVIP